MASVNSPIRKRIKPLLFRVLGTRGYFWAQVYAKARDIKGRLVEEDEMDLIPKLVRQGDEVIDLGANYVYHSVFMSQLVGKEGAVYAFEPVPFTHGVGAALLKYFRAGNVQLFNLGAAEKNAKVPFHIPVQDFGALSAGQAHLASRNNMLEGKETHYRFDRDETVECEVVRLDDFLLPKLKNLAFVKIDVEGAEYYALKGMVDIVRRFKPAMLVEIQPFFLKGFNIAEGELLGLIDGMGYGLYVYDKVRRTLKLHTGDVESRNYILIHREKLSPYRHLLESP